jgi:hypothetical protein
MAKLLNARVRELVFTQPESGGAFHTDAKRLMVELGQRRPLLLLAFAPKSAGTFLRGALIKAVDGQLVRTVHAQGGRDAQPYLPTFLNYFSGGVTTKTLVTHLHMQALPANEHFINAFGIRPIIMLRSIADMMASYWDMLDAADDPTDMGVNFLVPADFKRRAPGEKQEFLLRMLLPWYLSFYASWKSFAFRHLDRLLAVRFEDLVGDPVKLMAQILRHAGLTQFERNCAQAYGTAWKLRTELRYNQGNHGRGLSYFTQTQRESIRDSFKHYPGLAAWEDDLL